MIIIYSEIKFLDSFKFVLLKLITQTPLTLAWSIYIFLRPFVSLSSENEPRWSIPCLLSQQLRVPEDPGEAESKEPRVWNQNAWVQILLYFLLVALHTNP